MMMKPPPRSEEKVILSPLCLQQSRTFIIINPLAERTKDIAVTFWSVETTRSHGASIRNSRSFLLPLITPLVAQKGSFSLVCVSFLIFFVVFSFSSEFVTFVLHHMHYMELKREKDENYICKCRKMKQQQV